MSYRLHDTVVNIAGHPLRWPLARLARCVGPSMYIPGVGVIINSVALAAEVLQRDQEFTKNGKGSISAVITQLVGPVALTNMDGDAHRQLRSKLTDLLSPSRVSLLLDACRQPLDDMVRHLSAGHAIDLVHVMRTLSGRLAMEMIGINASARTDEAARDMVALAERMAAKFRLRPLNARGMRRMQVDIDHLSSQTRRAYDDAETGRGLSLVGRLRSLGASFEETRGIVSIFVVAGTLTTALSLPRIVALLIDSGQFGRLRDGRESIARALDEGLRYVTPVPATVRIAAGDVTLQGRRVRAGTRIVILTANLTRDAHVFPDPFRFDVDRVHEPRGRHLWYGMGPHFCFGFSLAQTELERVLESLAALPDRLVIVRRRPAFGALLPRYNQLFLRLMSA